MKKIEASLICIFWLFLLVPFSARTQYSSGNKIAVYIGAQVLTHRNALHFNNSCEVDGIYEGLGITPMLTPSVGIKTGRILQIFDYWQRSLKDFHAFDVGISTFKMRYYSYQVSYDFFPKWRFPVKPFIALSAAYATKNLYVSYSDGTGGRENDLSETDLAKEWIIQVPTGIQVGQSGLSLSVLGIVPIYTRLKGNYVKDTYWSDNMGRTYAKHYASDYTLHYGSNNINKSPFTLSIRLAFTFPNKLGKKTTRSYEQLSNSN